METCMIKIIEYKSLKDGDREAKKCHLTKDHNR